MSKQEIAPKPKKLTSYRKMVLRKYNTKPFDMTDSQFCYRHKINFQELQAWQQLAGQDVYTKLKEMRTVKRAADTAKDSANTPFSYKKFYDECSKIIELTCGGRPTDKISGRSKDFSCEVHRYELLQKIAALPNSRQTDWLLFRLLGEI
jgi:hypothetical protein